MAQKTVGREIPKIREITDNSFQMLGDRIIVSLEAGSSERVEFSLEIRIFLAGLTAAVVFMNNHLGAILDMLDIP